MAAARKTPAAKPPTKPRTRKPAAAKAAKPASPKRTAPKATAAKAAPRLGLISAIAVGVVAAGSAIALFGRRLFAPGNAEHPAPDLALDQPHNDGSRRAPEAFRPDPTAPVPASEREGLRPATGIPSLVTH